MELTRQSEYAIRTLIELAGAPEGVFIQSRVIAEKHSLPEKFLHKTIQVLGRTGFVETRRGMQGGIRLAVPAASLTIADIVVAIEGRIAINPCLNESYYCKHKSACRVNGILQRAQEAMIAELSKETIADLAGEEQKAEAYTRGNSTCPGIMY